MRRKLERRPPDQTERHRAPESRESRGDLAKNEERERAAGHRAILALRLRWRVPAAQLLDGREELRANLLADLAHGLHAVDAPANLSGECDRGFHVAPEIQVLRGAELTQS